MNLIFETISNEELLADFFKKENGENVK